jgi:hypothetical protein
MIFFKSRPDSLFDTVFKRAMTQGVDNIEVAQEIEEDFYLEPEVTRVFGSMQNIKKHVEELLGLYRSSRFYQISRYSYFLIDRILKNYCSAYNDIIMESSNFGRDGLEVEGKYAKELDYNKFIGEYFWDTDYDTGPEAFIDLPDDLEPREVKVDEEKWEEA